MPDIYEDLQTCFLSEPPSWLVLPVEKGVLPEFIDEMLGKDYQIVDQNDYYILYQYHKLGDMYLYNN